MSADGITGLLCQLKSARVEIAMTCRALNMLEPSDPLKLELEDVFA
jgi:hypothetical protein